jgi:hypothetical protein
VYRIELKQMGVGYSLVNFSKKEWILFQHIAASKARELAGNPASAAITTWYLLNNQGDQIAFVSDTYGEWPFPEGSPDDLTNYREVTDEVVKALIREGILADEGKERYFDDESDLYHRKLRNVWLRDEEKHHGT